MTDDLRLQDFLPESQLVLPEHHIERARFPAIDAHNHMRWLHSGSDQPQDSHPEALIAALDRHNVRGIVTWTDSSTVGSAPPSMTSRPSTSTVSPSWRRSTVCHQRARLAGRPRAAVPGSHQAGVDGLKIFKSLGADHSR